MAENYRARKNQSGAYDIYELDAAGTWRPLGTADGSEDIKEYLNELEQRKTNAGMRRGKHIVGAGSVDGGDCSVKAEGCQRLSSPPPVLMRVLELPEKVEVQVCNACYQWKIRTQDWIDSKD